MRRRQHPAIRTWHVFARGARRLALFYEEGDYRQFLAFLQEALILSGCEVIGYALMGNHYHLMLRGAQAQISQCMQRLNWRFALYHNDRHHMGGHVFDGPYKAYPQRTLKWLLWRLAYIFLNPVKAGLAGRAEEYPWSGYRSFMGEDGSLLAVAPLPELAAVGRDLSEARAYFRGLLEEQQARGEDRSGTTPTARAIQRDQFDWVCRQAEARARLHPGVDAESLALWWGKEIGVPPSIMVDSLGLGSRYIFRRRITSFSKTLERNDELARRLTL